jgi:hypothetical protein
MNKIKTILLILITANSLFAANSLLDDNSAILVTDRHCYISGDNIFVRAITPKNTNEAVLYIDLATTENVFIKGEILRLEGGNSSGFIQIPDTLKTGNFLLRAYTYNSRKHPIDKVLAKELIYITNRFGNNGVRFESEIKAVNDSLVYIEEKDANIDILLSNTEYAKRSKVSFVVKNMNETSFEGFHGALSVRPVSVCEQQNQKLNWNSTLESVMSTSNSDEQISSENVINENKGIIISGIAKHKVTNNPIPRIMILMAFEDSVIRIKQCITDSSGNFSFLVTNCFERQDVYLSAYSYPNMELLTHVGMKLNNKFLNGKFEFSSNGKFNGYQQSTDSLNLMKSIITKAYDINNFKTVGCNNGDEISYEHSFIAGELSRTTLIDDYVSLPDFYQIAREILPFVRIKIRNDSYKFILFDGNNNLVRENPMVLVDGIPLTNYKELKEWGSDRIKRIQVKVEPRYYGDVPFENGLILIWTRKLDFWKSANCVNTHKFTIPSFQKDLIFDFPNYSSTLLGTFC